MRRGRSSTAMAGSGGGGGGGGGPTADAGPPLGLCSALHTGPKVPGQYAGAGGYDEAVLLKREDAASLCLRIYLVPCQGSAYGVEPVVGWGISKVELTNAPADCDLPPDAVFCTAYVPPMGQVVEAACGAGSFTAVTACDPQQAGAPYALTLEATFHAR